MKILLQSKQESQWNEVVFQQRNKAYGAFVLRNEEAWVLQKSLLLSFAFLGMLSSFPFVIDLFKTKEIVNATPIDGFILKEIQQIDKNNPVKESKTNNTQTLVLPIKSLPVPTKNVVKEITSKEIKSIGQPTNNVQNTNSGGGVIPEGIDLGGKEKIITETVRIEVPMKISNEPYKNVDVEAEFPGGVNVFRNQISKNFDVSNFEGTDELIKATVNFVVEKDGSISQLNIKGNDDKFNKEAEKTIKAIRIKWKPAKIEGKEVRSYFSVPISMQFE